MDERDFDFLHIDNLSSNEIHFTNTANSISSVSRLTGAVE